ncbi:MAG: flavodoxin domain-containing protein [Candidatus Geothermincolia bacterium]
MKALIVYHTKTGHTLDAANDIAKGLRESGTDVTMMPAIDASPGDVDGCDIFVAGSPTYGNTRYKAPAKSVAKLLDSLKPSGLKGKCAGGFTVFAGYGGEKIVTSIEELLSGLGATVVAGGPAVKAGAPLSLWKGPDASAPDVAKCVEFGRRLAEAAG